MSTIKEKPDASGVHVGTGLPSDVKQGNKEKQGELPKKVTDKNDKISEGLKTENSNSGMRKGNPTNAHSYKY